MYGKVIILAFFAISTCFAQTPTCGNVQIQPMTPAQVWNYWSWWGPGAIAASDCYTQYLLSVQNSLTGLYNAAYMAGPPSQIQTPQTGQQQNNMQQQQQQQQQPQTNQQQQQPQTNQQPATNQQQPATNQQQPATNQQQPATNQQQPATNQQQPATNQQQPATNQQQPAANQQQPPTNQ